SPQNEPIFSHWFESCVFTPAEYAELLETISWMFAHEGEQASLFGPEHMTWDIGATDAYLAAAAQRRTLGSLTAVASHGYVDGYLADQRPAITAPFGHLVASYAKKAWITEGGSGRH